MSIPRADGTHVIVTTTRSGIRASVRYGRDEGQPASPFRIHSVHNLKRGGIALQDGEKVPEIFRTCLKWRWNEVAECVKWIREKL